MNFSVLQNYLIIFLYNMLMISIFSLTRMSSDRKDSS